MKTEKWTKALSAFQHPLTWLMILLLAFNDLILKPLDPSWWSGKLSDVALLYLLPLILIGLVSGISGNRLQPKNLWLCFALPAILFIFGKTLPMSNQLIYQLMNWLLPFPTHFVLDPSDLIALVSVPLAWMVWSRSRVATITPTQRPWLALVLALPLIVADAAAPRYGITCLKIQEEGTILARDLYYGNIFYSQDSGQTWDSMPDDQNINWQCDDMAWRSTGEQFTIDDSTGRTWRFTVGEKIEVSTDDGQTWQTEFNLYHLSEAEEAYRKRQQSTLTFIPGPTDVVLDPASGNLIAAMGHAGILLRTPEKGWQWVSVGPYTVQQNLKELGVAGLFSLLWGEWLLGLLAAIFLVSLFNVQIRRRWWRVVKVVLALLGWLLLLLLSPTLSDSYIYPLLITIAFPVAAIWGLFCLVDDIISWQRQPTRLWRLMVSLGILAGFLIALLYLLWGMAVIPQYETTLMLGLLVFLTAAVAGSILLRAQKHREENIDEQP